MRKDETTQKQNEENCFAQSGLAAEGTLGIFKQLEAHFKQVLGHRERWPSSG